jgi:hypothetical protein
VSKLTNKDGSEVHLYQGCNEDSLFVVLYDDIGVGVNGGFTHAEAVALVKAIINVANIHPEEIR